MLPTAIHYTPGSNGVLPPTAFLYNSLLIWSLNAISTDFGTAGWNERFREFLLASAVIPACLSALDPRPESERTWLSTPPPIQCSPFWSPLLFMLYWSKELPNPLPNPPPALTRAHIYTHTHPHKHRKPSKIVGTAQTGGVGVGGLRKKGQGEEGHITGEKKKTKWKLKKKIYRSKSLEFHWLCELLWFCYSLSARPAPFPAFSPLWKLWHLLWGGWGENRGGGEEAGRRALG